MWTTDSVGQPRLGLERMAALGIFAGHQLEFCHFIDTINTINVNSLPWSVLP